MARIRSIKPEFWKSEAIARLSHFDRLLFIALWSYVDDNGVGRDVPPVIAGELFPLERDPRESLANVQRGLATLSEAGRITRYTVEAKPFLHITNWDEHQRIDKPNKPRYPLPSDPSALLTSGYGDSRETLAEPSRESRESPAPGAVEQGAGSREQGSISLARPEPSEPDGFAAWYAAYPRHTARAAAAKAYKTATAKAPTAVLLAAALRFAEDTTRDPAFTPHPATWLNGERWLDEGPARPAARPAPNRSDERTARNLALVEQFRQAEQGQLGIGSA